MLSSNSDGCLVERSFLNTPVRWEALISRLAIDGLAHSTVPEVVFNTHLPRLMWKVLCLCLEFYYVYPPTFVAGHVSRRGNEDGCDLCECYWGFGRNHAQTRAIVSVDVGAGITETSFQLCLAHAEALLSHRDQVIPRVIQWIRSQHETIFRTGLFVEGLHVTSDLLKVPLMFCAFTDLHREFTLNMVDFFSMTDLDFLDKLGSELGVTYRRGRGLLSGVGEFLVLHRDLRCQIFSFLRVLMPYSGSLERMHHNMERRSDIGHMDELMYVSREPSYINDANNEDEVDDPIQLWYMVPQMKALDVTPELDDFSDSVLLGMARGDDPFSYETMADIYIGSIVVPTLKMMRERNFEGAYMHALYYACNTVVTLSDRLCHGVELEARDAMALRGISSILMYFIEDRDPAVTLPLQRGFLPAFSTTSLSVLIHSSSAEQKAQLEQEFAPFSIAILEFVRGLRSDELSRKYQKLIGLGGTRTAAQLGIDREWRRNVCEMYHIKHAECGGSIGIQNAGTNHIAFDSDVQKFVAAICNA